MICPHCTVGEISPDSGECVLCGASPSGQVTVDKPVVDETVETVQRELEGRFRIANLIGRGTRSVVFLAQDMERDKPVAVKVIPLQRGLFPDLSRFDREARVAASLNHSHIVPIFDSGSTSALLWYSMKYVKGESLADVIRESGRLDLEFSLTIIEQAASALDYIHRRGLVHGNVKPSNILLDSNQWVRVSDAAVMGAFGSPPGAAGGKGAIGTPEYAAPERFRARTGSASVDQYALAVVAYECLSGALPFVGDAPEEIERQHRTDMPPLLSAVRGDIPGHVDEAIQRAMSKAVVERFPNVLDFVSLLRGDWVPQDALPLVPEEAAGRPQVVLIDQSAEADEEDGLPPIVLSAPKGRRFRFSYLVLAILGVILVESVILWRRPAPVSPTGPELRMVTPETFTIETPPLAPRAEGGTEAAPTTPRSADPTPVSPQNEPPTQGSRVGARPAGEGDPVPVRIPPVREPVEQPVTRPPIRTAEPRRVPPTPLEANAGQLFINSNPWGQLYVDGELVGNTPKGNLLLTPGTHHIRVSRDGFQPFEIEVEVAPRQQIRLTSIVLRPVR